MNLIHGIIALGGLSAGFGLSTWLHSGEPPANPNPDSDQPAEPLNARARADLQAARARANRIQVIETKVFEPVNVGRSAAELIANLKTVKANSPEAIQRRSVHYLESLVDLGPKAVLAFRQRRFDPSLSGVGYTVKCLGLNDPADVYESAKFGHEASQLMLSDGLQKVLKAITMRTERTLSTLKEGGK